MSDPALVNAGLYGATAASVILAAGKWRVNAALGLCVAAAALATAAGFAIGYAGQSFSAGFGAASAEQGLGLLVVIWIAGAAQACGAGAWLARVGRRHGLVRLAPVTLGVLAGPAALPAVALAIIQPVAAGLAASRRREATIETALACSAAHGWLLPSPVMIAAVTILGADWRTVLAIGLPGALLLAAFGMAVQAVLPRLTGEEVTADLPPASAPAAMGLLLAAAAMLVMLTIRSLGDIPSEPLGGGHARELVIGLGRPLALLIAGGAIVLASTWGSRGQRGRVPWESVAQLVLTVAAAGGLQFVAQDMHMAEILADRAASEPWGLAAPFAVAALFKLLQGNSLTAAISAAGILQPLLQTLGLDTPWDRALAALAVGAGSMAGANVNDGFFWLAANLSGLRADQAFLRITLPTAMQGLLALLILLFLGLFG